MEINTDLDILLDELKKTLGFSVDQPFERNAQPNEDDFYNKLYVPLPTQDDSFKQRVLKHPNHFTVIAGPTGRGKTSLLLKTLKSVTPQLNYFLFDFKKQIEKLYGMGESLNHRQQFLHDLFKEELSQQFLNKISDKIDFTFTALMKYFYPNRMHKRIFTWRDKYSKSDIGENEDDLKTIFLKDYTAIREEEEFVMKNLTCSQMITCITESKNLNNFFVVLDNVDRLNSGIQPALFSVAIDIFHGGNGNFGVLVAVREKNILRYELTTHGGDVIEVISLQTLAKERTRPIKMHALDKMFVEQLLDKRYNFVSDILVEHSLVEIISVFNQLKPLIKRKFLEEKIYNMSNHNLRTMLTLNYEFIYYIIHLVKNKTIVDKYPQLDLNEEKINSYFFRWIYAVANQRHELLLNVAERYDLYLKKSYEFALECDIEMVVLCYLVNTSHYNQRVNDVCNAFSSIGVKCDMIINTIFKLYHVGDDVKYIDLGDSEAAILFDDIRKMNPRIIITPLGVEFIKSTITKFEFLFHCLEYPNVVNLDSPEMLRQIHSDRDYKIEKVIVFLNKMKDVHINALKYINERSKDTQHDWEEYYRNGFCIDSKLIFERILVSHVAHFKTDEITTRYQELLDEYYDGFKAKTRIKL